MHDHDLDLIADFASGTPSPEAAALVESCADCQAEYQRQVGVRQVLESSPVEPLSEFERARLHREVLQAVAPAVAPRRERWWERRSLPLVSVAAALFVGVGLVGVLGQLSNDSGDAFATAESATAADDASDELTAEVPPQNARGALAEEATPADDAGVVESDGDFGFALASPTIDIGAVDREGLSAEIERQRTALSGTGSPDADVTGDEPPATEPKQIECPLPEASVVLVAELDGRPLAVAVGVFEPSAETGSDVEAVWTDTCESLDLG